MKKTAVQYHENMASLLGDIRKWQAQNKERQLERQQQRDEQRKQREIEVCFQVLEALNRKHYTENVWKKKHDWEAGREIDV